VQTFAISLTQTKSKFVPPPMKEFFSFYNIKSKPFQRSMSWKTNDPLPPEERARLDRTSFEFPDFVNDPVVLGAEHFVDSRRWGESVFEAEEDNYFKASYSLLYPLRKELFCVSWFYKDENLNFFLQLVDRWLKILNLGSFKNPIVDLRPAWTASDIRLDGRTAREERKLLQVAPSPDLYLGNTVIRVWSKSHNGSVREVLCSTLPQTVTWFIVVEAPKVSIRLTLDIPSRVQSTELMSELVTVERLSLTDRYTVPNGNVIESVYRGFSVFKFMRSFARGSPAKFIWFNFFQEGAWIGSRPLYVKKMHSGVKMSNEFASMSKRGVLEIQGVKVREAHPYVSFKR